MNLITIEFKIRINFFMFDRQLDHKRKMVVSVFENLKLKFWYKL